MLERYRDVLLFYEETTAYVISCDSSGSIGSKPCDRLKADAAIVGRFLLRVALSEVLCVGAKPVIISDTLSAEMHPTGEKIIKGITRELEENGFYDVVLTGSTEENFVTGMTAAGITVIARANKSDLKIRKAKSGMDIALLGVPRVGAEVLASTGILTLNDYTKICGCPAIMEAIPVGSKGIKHELDVLGSTAKLTVKARYPESLDVHKSGGPSTCCIVVYNKKDTGVITNLLDKPFMHLGCLQ